MLKRKPGRKPSVTEDQRRKIVALYTDEPNTNIVELCERVGVSKGQWDHVIRVHRASLVGEQ